MAARTQQSSGSGIPFVTGTIGGAVSFVVGYLLTLIVVVAIESGDLADDVIEATGFLYYNAQFAPIEVSVDGAGGGGGGFGSLLEQEFNYLTDSQFSQALDAPSILYHLIPILVLFLGGFAVARSVDARDIQEGAIAGATIVLGTVVLAVLGTFLFSVSNSGTTTSPVLVEGVLLVGLVFPGVLGAIGGAVSTQVGSGQQQQYGRR
jgi:hypothetical protein